ncbi:MarR family winged helix-turn-helix transcriptional regulator [Herbiconiux ginsengi]|nr:MarR family winged helix-turn-helix transcriptional regulator [Herbiconiux ginsengi]
MSIDEPFLVSAERFDDAFQRVYLAFHRRDGTDHELSGVSRAVLRHLSFSGPVTIGDASRHLRRAQSVVSDIMTQLEHNGLVERRRDVDDRRRVLVWLTPAGVAALRRDASVLSHELLAHALARLGREQTDAILAALDELVVAAEPPRDALESAAPPARAHSRHP